MKNWLKKFRSGLFTKAQFVVGTTIVMVTTSALVYAYQLISMNLFSAGQVISSEKINQNFQTLTALVGMPFAFKLASNQTINSTVPSNYANWAVFDGVKDYEYSPYNYTGSYVSDGKFTIQQTGLYQIIAYGKFTSGAGYIKMFKNVVTTPTWVNNLSTIYLSNTAVSNYINNYFLNSGDVISIKAHTWYTSATIDASKTKITFKKL